MPDEHWFQNLAHAQAVIEAAWRREYNEERPKKALGGLTPAAYARQLTKRSAQYQQDSKRDCYLRRGDIGGMLHHGYQPGLGSESDLHPDRQRLRVYLAAILDLFTRRVIG